MIVSKKSNGFTCPECGGEAILAFFVGNDLEKMKGLAPILMRFRMSVMDWMKAMEYAFGTENIEASLKCIESFKEWLDEEAIPMVESVRQIHVGEKNKDPIPDMDVPEGPQGL